MLLTKIDTELVGIRAACDQVIDRLLKCRNYETEAEYAFVKLDADIKNKEEERKDKAALRQQISNARIDIVQKSIQQRPYKFQSPKKLVG